jgi:hypothetical protein
VPDAMLAVNVGGQWPCKAQAGNVSCFTFRAMRAVELPTPNSKMKVEADEAEVTGVELFLEWSPTRPSAPRMVPDVLASRGLSARAPLQTPLP